VTERTSLHPGTNQRHEVQAIVLVGFAEAMSAPEAVWSLFDSGFHVIAFARKGRPSALRHSRHVVCYEICPPESDLQVSLSDLRALMASVRANAGGAPLIFFPFDDKAVWLGNKLGPTDGWLLAGPTGAQAELALNKCVQTRMAREAGFNVPQTVLARTSSEVLDFAKRESFPIILKAAECVPTREGRVHTCRKWICANSSELEGALAEWAECVPLLVQSFVRGTGEGLFGLAAPEGVRAWSAHRRLRMMNPQGSGSSACISQSVPEDLKATAEKMIRTAGWRGVFMIELLREDSGKLWFVELNGRPWGSMSLSRRQGLEYPAWHVELAMDAESRAGAVQTPPPCLVCRHVGREFMHLLFVIRGAKSKALDNWPPFWKTIADMVSVRQGDAYYNWRRNDAKVFFADCYYTVHDNVFKEKQ
jgi:hypothetical protein